jgi:hypothetical protein
MTNGKQALQQGISISYSHTSLRALRSLNGIGTANLCGNTQRDSKGLARKPGQAPDRKGIEQYNHMSRSGLYRLQDLAQ